MAISKAVIKSTVMDPEMLDFTLSKASFALSQSSTDEVFREAGIPVCYGRKQLTF